MIRNSRDDFHWHVLGTMYTVKSWDLAMQLLQLTTHYRWLAGSWIMSYKQRRGRPSVRTFWDLHTSMQMLKTFSRLGNLVHWMPRRRNDWNVLLICYIEIQDILQIALWPQCFGQGEHRRKSWSWHSSDSTTNATTARRIPRKLQRLRRP